MNVIERDKQKVAAAAATAATALVNGPVLTNAVAAIAAVASTKLTPSLSPLASLPLLSIAIAASAAVKSMQLYSQDYAEKLVLIFSLRKSSQSILGKDRIYPLKANQ